MPLATPPRWRATSIRLLAHTLLAAVVVCGLALVARHALDPGGTGIDDANIFFRYARNLADGEGLVFNPGSERVEGFSSLAWVLLLAAAFGLGVPVETWGVAIAALAVSSGIAAWLVTTPRHEERIPPGRRWLLAGLGLLWIAALPPYLIWGVATGMDTGLWCAAVLWAWRASERFATGSGSARGAVLALGILPVVRSEGVAVGIGLGIAGWLATPATPVLGYLRRALPILVTPVATFAALTGLRLWYFGQPLPNTFYAKVIAETGERLGAGVDYLRRAISENPSQGLLTILAVLVLAGACYEAWPRARAGRRAIDAGTGAAREAGAAGPALVFLFGPLLVLTTAGGDHFPGSRFLLPFWPVGYTMVWRAVEGLGRRWPRRAGSGELAGAAAVVALAILTYASGASGWNQLAGYRMMRNEFRLAEEGRHAGAWLNQIFTDPTSRPLVATGPAGGLPYTYEGWSYDVWGLNDLATARASPVRSGPLGHAAFSVEVFLERRPEVFVTSFWCASDNAAAWRESNRFPELFGGINQVVAFRQQYRPVRIGGGPVPRGHELCAWVRGDFLANAPAGWYHLR